MRILHFNPETEYALASGASFYTPPKSVVQLKKEGQLLPEAWAEPGDIILVDDKKGLQSDFQLATWEDLPALLEENAEIEIMPWGWNHALARKLIDSGVPEEYVPDKRRLDAIREYAHRRQTIRLNTLWNEMTDAAYKAEVPKELFSEDECIGFLRSHQGCWMKAPWSSSGRGVINTAADMTEEGVRQWCRGILRRQGSVMGENCASRVADFATEWRMKGGAAYYLGLSSFVTSRRGKYIENSTARQDEIAEDFCRISNIGPHMTVSLQKEILEKTFVGYEGPLGVDMMVEEGGGLRPFVEVNLRMTMGMVYL